MGEEVELVRGGVEEGEGIAEDEWTMDEEMAAMW